MKLAKKSNINIILFVLLISVAILISCDKQDEEYLTTKKKPSSSSSTTGISAKGPVSVKKYDVPPGADPNVPANLGGKGFTGEGWQTNKNFDIYGDPKAKKGGKITTGIVQYLATLRTEGKDSSSYYNSLVGSFIYERLLSIDSKTLKYVPALATHWKVSQDKKTYWFRIDPNARWNDGKPVTSQDVVATWNLLVDKGILAPYSNILYENYEKPVAESKYIVRVQAKKLDWRLFLYIAASTSIFPSHHLDKTDGAGYLKKYNDKMLPGTGPYVFDGKNSKKGKVLVMRRRNDYWAENYKVNTGLNNFDEINFLVVRDDVLQKEKFKKGEIDVYEIYRAQWWVEEFNKQNKKFDSLYRGLIQKKKVFNFKPHGLQGFAFNMRKAPFNDIRVRKAFVMLFNRDQLIDKLFFNEYKKITSAYPGSIYANPNNTVYDYNPDKANQLLDEAGWAKRNNDGFRVNKNNELFELELSITQDFERVVTPYQEDLKKAGIKLHLKITDYNTKSKMVDERRFKLMFQSYTGLFFPNPENSLLSTLADKDNNNNITGIKNKRIDKICSKYNEMFDQENRIKAIKEIDKILSETVHYVYAWHAPYGTRLVHWNKFGMPKGIIPYSGRTENLLTLWWHDPELTKKLARAKKDKSIKFPTDKVNYTYWRKGK